MDTFSNIEFRPCIPSDVELAIPLIYSSGPDAFSYVFNNGKFTALDFLRSAFQTKGGEFSYDNHIAMLLDDELIGIGSAFSGDRGTSFTISDALKIMKQYKLGAVKIMSRGLRVEQLIKLPKGDQVALAHIAIIEKMRSKGYGQKLMEHLMDKAKFNKDEHFVLDVSAINPRAKALYERLGFTVTKENKSKLKNKYAAVPDHYRMEKKNYPMV